MSCARPLLSIYYYVKWYSWWAFHNLIGLCHLPCDPMAAHDNTVRHKLPLLTNHPASRDHHALVGIDITTINLPITVDIKQIQKNCSGFPSIFANSKCIINQLIHCIYFPGHFSHLSFSQLDTLKSNALNPTRTFSPFGPTVPGGPLSPLGPCYEFLERETQAASYPCVFAMPHTANQHNNT